MFEELGNSIKSRLWDLKTTPFMSSFFIFFLFFNREYILFYFSEIEVDKKISLLSGYQIDIISPMIFAVGYVFIYPLIFWLFYSFTLFMNEQHNKTKQSIQKNRLLSVKDSIELRNEHEKYEEQIEKYINELKEKETEIETTKNILIDKYSKKEKELSENFEKGLKKYTEDISDLEFKLKTSNKLLDDETEKCKRLEEELELLKNPKSDNKNKGLLAQAMDESNKKRISLMNSLTSDEKNILHLFHEDHTYLFKSDMDKELKSKYDLKQGKIDLAVKNLKSKKLLEFGNSQFYLTDLGLEISNEMF